MHTATSTTEVWHVQSGDLDYYIAHCDCDWAGPSRDTDEPHALHDAESDARHHSRLVAPDVVDMEI